MLFVAEEEHECQADGESQNDKYRTPGCGTASFVIESADGELADALDREGKHGTEAVQAAAVAGGDAFRKIRPFAYRAADLAPGE